MDWSIETTSGREYVLFILFLEINNMEDDLCKLMFDVF